MRAALIALIALAATVALGLGMAAATTTAADAHNDPIFTRLRKW